MKNNQKIFVSIVLIAVVAVGGYFVLSKKSNNVNTILQTMPETIQPSTTLKLKNGVYEDQYMKVMIPVDWAATQSIQTVYYTHCASFKSDCTETPEVELKPGAIDIKKGNYILHIDSQAGQASGIEGGRFGEITNNAPSVKAVMSDPSVGGYCGTAETEPAMINNLRNDLFVGPKDNKNYLGCIAPANGGTVWYFSYIGSNSYFNYYKNQTENVQGYIITMSYNSDDVNSLPIKGSASQTAALSEMTSIANTLELKTK